ncbi:Pimeloyl-ACP methyl ester carboxylesterase [Nocardioides sp. YR527]|uniref:alpha/beta fold hydrolase n=1 Tax=Nocardioides sp. YR527 TaxID=1881028 RepID=UPI00088C8DCA|nr:alpha/beta hydrolase [Nocardioides sp. YR527]SDJ78817.1 Pimeloyl-ACP methyl ester carboxylesterase [Nocardioides sp. YR527]
MSRPHSLTRTARAAVLAPILVLLAALLTGAAQPPVAGTALPAGTSAAKPTVVLVHGAFADASGWNDVAARLAAKGFPVVAPPNPLRGLTSDTAYLETFLSTISGPIVLVGHSYGGAVITNAATGDPDVKALVYVAAYALDEGENVAAANELGGGHSDLLENIVVRPYPGAPEGDGDVYVDPAAFRSIFAHDLPRAQTVAMAAGQRPATFGALVTPSAEPAWRTVPSWYLIAGDDHLIPPVAQAAMAERADARTRTVDSSHVAMMSHPRATTEMILQAAYATSRSGRP